MKFFVERFRRLCGFLTGFVFFISGILKLLDPVGAGLVMNEYFTFLHLGFLSFSAKVAGTAFALAETIIGTALITGVWRRSTAIAAMAFQAFFTILTLFLLIFNPEMDCGCFGEAIHLTHMQTFLKNLVLCALLAAAFIPFRGLGRPRPRKYVSFGIVTMAVVAFMIYSWIYIPMVDFTDFKPGTSLASGDTSAEDAYEARFIYEKDGVQESFDLNHLPDSTWTFVSTETVLKKDYVAPVTISFTGPDGEYADHLAAEGKVMIISVYNPDMRQGKWERTAKLIADSRSAGITPVLLVASAPEETEEAFAGLPEGTSEVLKSCIFHSDRKTLMTLNRSNCGATYFNDGTLICKWAFNALPGMQKLEELAKTNGLEESVDKDTKGSLGFQGFLLYVFAVMLLL